MASPKDILIKILGEDNFSRASKSVNRALAAISKTAKTVKVALKGVTVGFAAIAAIGVGALAPIISTGAQFEQAMAQVASVTGAAGNELKEMSRAARAMAEVTTFTATQAAEAMYALGSAGFDTKQTMDALEGTLQLAGATQSELAFTAQTVVSTLSQFGLEAEAAGRVSNVFAAAIKNSQLNMQRLADGMKYVGPVAKSVRWSLEQTTAILGQFNNAGFMGEMAGNSLKNAISRLLNPTKEIQSILSKYNLTLGDVNPATNSFSEIIGRLNNAALEGRDVLAIFGDQAGPAMLAAMEMGAEAFELAEEKITDTNAAAEMLAIATDTLKGYWELFVSALQEFFLAVFEWVNPAMKSIIEGMTDLIKSISSNLKTWTLEWEQTHGDLDRVMREYWDDKIKPFIRGAMEFIDTTWKDTVAPALEGNWADAWDNLYDYVVQIFADVVAYMENWAKNDAGPILVKLFGDIALSAAASFWDNFTNLFKNLWQQFKEDAFGGAGTGKQWEAWNNSPYTPDSATYDPDYRNGGSGYQTRGGLPGGHDQRHYSGTHNTRNQYNFNVNLPPGTDRQSAAAFKKMLERMAQTGHI